MAADNGQMSFRRGVMSLVILGLLKKKICMAISLCRKQNERVAEELLLKRVHYIRCFTNL